MTHAVPAVRRAATAFRDTHSRAPIGVWSAPGRVNLIGEHTDYNDGFVLPFALSQRTAVAAAPRTDGLLVVTTVGNNGGLQRAKPVAVADLAPGRMPGWASYPSGVAWVLREESYPVAANVVIASDVPTGAGLASSAALECAVLLALLGVAGREVGSDHTERAALARWVQRAENDFVGVPSGVLDQTAALCCQEAQALFLDVRSGAAEQVGFNAPAAGLSLLVIDTRARHKLGSTAGGDGYRGRRSGCDRAARLLGVPSLRDVDADDLASLPAHLPPHLIPLVRHVVTENARVLTTVNLMRHNQLADIGSPLTASHHSLRDDYRVSCVELDLAVDTALAAGAIGARMTGAGFGGSAIALVPVRVLQPIEQAITDAFAARSWAVPRLFTAVPSPGAGRDS